MLDVGYLVAPPGSQWYGRTDPKRREIATVSKMWRMV